MIFWFCAGLTLCSAVGATFISEMRRSVLALWLTGLGVGGLYLSMGAELLAIVQWIVSTLIAITFIFYAVMFGEYGVSDPRPVGKKLLSAVLPMTIAVAFFSVLALGSHGLPGFSELRPAPAAPMSGPIQTYDLEAVGRYLSEEHPLALVILGLTLFLVVVGAGVVARPEVLDR